MARPRSAPVCHRHTGNGAESNAISLFREWANGCPLQCRYTPLTSFSLSSTLSLSVGVGRTGTFIVIYSMIERMKANKNTVDIYGQVSLLRTQRNYMVQTEVKKDIVSSLSHTLSLSLAGSVLLHL